MRKVYSKPLVDVYQVSHLTNLMEISILESADPHEHPGGTFEAGELYI